MPVSNLAILLSEVDAQYFMSIHLPMTYNFLFFESDEMGEKFPRKNISDARIDLVAIAYSADMLPTKL